jgi:membrane peptidoglycan carboxypeptidase
MSSRTTSIGGVVRLLGAFLASALVLGLLAAGLVMPAVGATGALARSGVDVFNELPSEFSTDPLAQTSRILAADGTVIATPQEQNRTIVPLSKIAPIMRTAQVDIEDHRFYDHGGIDLQGTARAVISNLRNGSSVGASSLTQQYVKISLQYSALSSGDKEAAADAVKKDYLRKLKELKYAITLEKKLTKDQILQGYLNLVYYGDRAYGVEAAAQHYFSVPASKLSLSQAALLAGMTQNPGTTDPVHYPKRALARRNVVLDRMHELGSITDKQWTAAKKRTLKQDMKVTEPKSTCLASPYPYWCEFVINYAMTMPQLGKTVEERKRTLYRGGITITTTLDPRIQRIVQSEVEKRVPIGDPSKVGAAAYVTEPGTGKVLGFAQNTKYTVAGGKLGATGISWALDKKYGGSGGFQYGSTAKAFALATAMESGLTTKSSVDAKAAGGDVAAKYSPSDFPKDKCSSSFKDWSVLNDTPFKGGKMTLMEATALSTNTAFVGLAQQIGICKIRDTMNLMGLHQSNGNDISIDPAAVILGANEVSPQTVANAYATLASDGKKCPVVVITKIVKDGKEIPLPASTCEQVIKPEIAQATDKFLEYNMTHGSGIRNQLSGGARESAGKTGTANGNNESWFAGYTPQISTAVWVGTPDDGNKRVMKNVTIGGKFYPVMHGAAVAAPIWKGIMDKVLEDQPIVKFTEPPAKYLGADTLDTTTVVPGQLPPVVGRSVSEVEAALQAAGFQTKIGGTMASTVPMGLVAGISPYQSPSPGSLITIYTSRGSSQGAAFATPRATQQRTTQPVRRTTAAARTTTTAKPAPTTATATTAAATGPGSSGKPTKPGKGKPIKPPKAA